MVIMAELKTKKSDGGFRFTLEEFSGALGDSLTVVPLIIGIALTAGFSLSHMLLFFGIFQIASGLYYKLPMPVEPMKGLAAVAIAGSLSHSGLVLSGILLGVLLLISGITGLMKKIDKFVPKSVVRGIQLGLALILLQTSIGYIGNHIWLALLGIIVVVLFLILKSKRDFPNIAAFVVILIGIIYGIYSNGFPPIVLMTTPSIQIPAISSLPDALIHGVLPQFFLTAGNAVLATSLLFKDLLNQKVDPDKISGSMGIMCITSSVFGGFPMCHGSGGLAGQYRFGARTGGSNIILGSIYLGIAFLAGSAEFLGFFPFSILGALLIFVALELGLAGKETESWTVTLITAILSLLTNIGVGFLMGLTAAKILDHYRR